MVALVFHKQDVGHTKRDVESCFQSVVKYSPQTSLRVIGDANPQTKGVVAVSDNGLYHSSRTVIGPYSKIFKQDQNPYWFEWTGLKRWFVFWDYCKRENIDRFWTFDSDVLVFCNLEEEAERYGKGAVVSVTKPEGSSIVSLGISCFHSLSTLTLFCEWLPGFLVTDQGRNLVSYSDMNLWTVFFQVHPVIKVNLLTDTLDGGSFDPNLGCIEGWKGEDRSKVLTWEKGFPYGVRNGVKERLKVLHCWYYHAPRMAEYYQKALASA